MTEDRSWYREPLVWLLISFPLTAVVAGIATYVIADRTKDGLVVDDYYKKGKEINLSLARDQAAARRGLKAQLVLDARAKEVVVALSARDGAGLPPRVALQWWHATRSGFDRTQELARGKDGRYRAALPALAPGHWYAQLEAEDWRLQGSLQAPGGTGIDFRPLEIAAGH